MYKIVKPRQRAAGSKSLILLSPAALLIMDGRENDQAQAERSSPDALAFGPSAPQSLTVKP